VKLCRFPPETCYVDPWEHTNIVLCQCY